MRMAAQPFGDKAERLRNFGTRHVFQCGVSTFQSIRLTVRLRDFAPGKGHHIILLHTLAEKIQCPEKKLSFGLALTGGFFKPGGRLDIILSDAETLVKQESETGLRWGIAVLGERVPIAERGDVVAAIIRRQAGSKIASSRRMSSRHQQDDEACETARRRGKHRRNQAQICRPLQPAYCLICATRSSQPTALDRAPPDASLDEFTTYLP